MPRLPRDPTGAAVLDVSSGFPFLHPILEIQELVWSSSPGNFGSTRANLLQHCHSQVITSCYDFLFTCLPVQFILMNE